MPEEAELLKANVGVGALLIQAHGLNGCAVAYCPATSRSNRGLPVSGANVGSMRSQPGER